MAAAVLATAAIGHGWLSAAAALVLAGVAGALVAMGRPFTGMPIRFILLLIITIAVGENTPDRAGLLLLMTVVALWRRS